MVTDTDKIVAACLAAAKAATEKPESRLQWVLEYERMLKVVERRSAAAAGDATANRAPDLV